MGTAAGRYEFFKAVIAIFGDPKSGSTFDGGHLRNSWWGEVGGPDLLKPESRVRRMPTRPPSGAGIRRGGLPARQGVAFRPRGESS